MEVAATIGDSGESFTTDGVLVEVLTFFARLGDRFRMMAAELVEELLGSPRMTVMRQTPELFDAGLRLYRARPDKTYSMTDCMSMAVCRQQRIRDVLTHDHDFQQEGFRILL